MTEIREHFDSVAAFVDKAVHGTPNSTRRSSHDPGAGWHGTETIEQAAEYAILGWPEGLDIIRDRVDKFNAVVPPTAMQRRETKQRVTAPGVINMGAYLQEKPKTWLQTRKIDDVDYEANYSKFVVINANVDSSGWVSSKEMFDKGAVICALIELLELNGKRVELNLYSSARWGHPSGHRAVFTIMAKKAHEPLDMETVAFLMANAGTSRRLAFSLFEQMPTAMAVSCCDNSGYGGCWDVEVPGALNVRSMDLYQDDFFGAALDEAQQYGEFKKYHIDWLRKHLAEYGVELEA